MTVYLPLKRRETSLPPLLLSLPPHDYTQGPGNDCILEFLLPRSLEDHSNYIKADWVFKIYEVHQVTDKETEVQR